MNGQHFLTGLCEHMRNLLVANDPQTHKLLDVNDDTKALYGEQSVTCGVAKIIAWLNIASDYEFRYKEANNKRLFVEICLMKLAAMTQQNQQQVRPS